MTWRGASLPEASGGGALPIRTLVMPSALAPATSCHSESPTKTTDSGGGLPAFSSAMWKMPGSGLQERGVFARRDRVDEAVEFESRPHGVELVVVDVRDDLHVQVALAQRFECGRRVGARSDLGFAEHAAFGEAEVGVVGVRLDVEAAQELHVGFGEEVAVQVVGARRPIAHRSHHRDAVGTPQIVDRSLYAATARETLEHAVEVRVDARVAEQRAAEIEEHRAMLHGRAG